MSDRLTFTVHVWACVDTRDGKFSPLDVVPYEDECFQPADGYEWQRFRLVAADAGCEWREDQDGGWWNTGCGKLFEFINDGPTANHMQFCPYCGRTLKEVVND